jgi:hypothetical protein
MKISLFVIFSFLVIQTTVCYAQDSKPGWFGAGLIIGVPTGLTVKYWLDQTHAIGAALGLGNVSVHADYLWHRWNIFPKLKSGRLGIYWGVGAKIKKRRTIMNLGSVRWVA